MPQSSAMTQLQWGRDQLIAERQLGRYVTQPELIASMGPRSADRGKHVVWWQATGELLASMGPRSADRGKLRTIFAWVVSHAASMGPRSADRGKAPTSSGSEPAIVCFNGA